MLVFGPRVIHGSLGPPQSGTQMVTCSFQPIYYLNTGIRGPININISLNRKKYVIITTIQLIINYLIFMIIQLIIIHENLLYS